MSNIPLGLLRAELTRRQDAADRPVCGSGGRKESYNTPLHVIALALILGLSTLGEQQRRLLTRSLLMGLIAACSFPIIARRFPRLPIPHRFLFLSRHFGTGVLIATAFVHLLPTAFVSLTDPCLPRFWNEGYPAMAGFIAMLSVMMVVTIEMFFALRGAGHSHGDDFTTIPGEGDEFNLGGNSNGHVKSSAQRSASFRQSGLRGGDSEQGISLHRISGSAERLVNGKDQGGDGEDADEEEVDSLDEFDPLTEGPSHLNQSDRSHIRNHNHLAQPDPKKLLLQCLLLEAGILFHSIFIGMAVSVSTGSAFIVLLVAISFHQTFEGFALGSRIAALIPDLFSPSSPKPWLMALAYGTTTPIGQAIGLVLHDMYDPASTTGLLVVGVTNAISSGLLLFAGLVELIAEDFLSDRSYETLRGRRRIEACLAVAGGGLLMALVGAWA